jgi:hypothetical protein
MIKCETCGKTILHPSEHGSEFKTWLAVSYCPYEEKPTYMFCSLKCLEGWIKKEMEKRKE